MTQIINNNKEQTMTSLEIAELTGKQHRNVMQAIRNMEPGWEKVAGLKFQLGSYKDLNGQLRPCYQLTKTECLYIATKFNDEARAKLVLRWEELERDAQRPIDSRRCGGAGARGYENTPAADISRTSAPPYLRTPENPPQKCLPNPKEILRMAD